MSWHLLKKKQISRWRLLRLKLFDKLSKKMTIYGINSKQKLSEKINEEKGKKINGGIKAKELKKKNYLNVTEYVWMMLVNILCCWACVCVCVCLVLLLFRCYLVRAVSLSVKNVSSQVGDKAAVAKWNMTFKSSQAVGRGGGGGGWQFWLQCITSVLMQKWPASNQIQQASITTMHIAMSLCVFLFWNFTFFPPAWCFAAVFVLLETEQLWISRQTLFWILKIAFLVDDVWQLPNRSQ